MPKITDRTEKLIGESGVRKLANAHVLVVGLGGVGGCVFEMLVRAGIGSITAVDCDRIEESNLNRQLLATVSTLGVEKAQAALMRAKEISPDCRVVPMCIRYCEENEKKVFAQERRYDYVADCIDSVKDKTALIVKATQMGIPIVSAMGSGNRLSPEFEVTDIYSTHDDGLARVMRKNLREKGVKSLSVVCDSGSPLKTDGVPGTISYAPNASGCVMARKIITDLICKE